MGFAPPVSEEKAWKDRGWLMHRGRRLLVAGGIIALAFFFALILIANYTSGPEQAKAYLIGDYVITLGIAVPGLILYMFRLYTERSIRRGNAKAFTPRAKLAFVSISWVVLAIAVVVVLVT